MDALAQMIIGDLQVYPEIIVVVRMVLVMFALELFACVVNFLGGVGRR